MDCPSKKAQKRKAGARSAACVGAEPRSGTRRGGSASRSSGGSTSRAGAGQRRSAPRRALLGRRDGDMRAGRARGGGARVKLLWTTRLVPEKSAGGTGGHRQHCAGGPFLAAASNDTCVGKKNPAQRGKKNLCHTQHTNASRRTQRQQTTGPSTRNHRCRWTPRFPRPGCESCLGCAQAEQRLPAAWSPASDGQRQSWIVDARG